MEKNFNDRITLYRAKSISDNKWIYGQIFCFPKHYNGVEPPSEEVTWYITNTKVLSYAMVEINPETICRSSPIKDMNDTLIFEDDVIEIISDYYKGKDQPKTKFLNLVKYKNTNHQCGFYMTNGQFSKQMINAYRYGYKVIGNIIDNPELMSIKPTIVSC